MHLHTILILALKISLSSCRSFGHKHHGSNQQLTDQNDIDIAYSDIDDLNKLKSVEFIDDIKGSTARSVDAFKSYSEKVFSQEHADLLTQEDNEKYAVGLIKFEKESRKIETNENYESENREEKNEEKDNEAAYSQHLEVNKEVNKSVERYMKNFLFDMMTLFQYEMKEFAEREKDNHRHQRKHRRPSLRPKRSIRSLLKDAHIKDILIKYFKQKQREENGKPLLRYG